MFEGKIAGFIGEKMFKDNEKEVFKSIKSHSIIGAILMMWPEYGLGIIIFGIVLWHMYSSICNKTGISFTQNFWKLVGVGVFVNILVALILNIVLTVLPILSGFIVYAQFYLSGKIFYERVKKLFGKVDKTT